MSRLPDWLAPVAALAAFLAVIAVILVGVHTRAKACEAKGGAFVRSTYGHVCIKADVIELP